MLPKRQVLSFPPAAPPPEPPPARPRPAPGPGSPDLDGEVKAQKTLKHWRLYMGVSINGGTPSYHPFSIGIFPCKPFSYWGTLILGNPQYVIIEKTYGKKKLTTSWEKTIIPYVPVISQR